MLTLKNKTTTTHADDEGYSCVVTRYDAEGFAQCNGSSIWDYEGDLKVAVSAVEVHNATYEDGDTSTMIYVEHTANGDGDWRIYTDEGFEESISKALGYDVTFTEQGMQDWGVASLET
jgi:hypothetical protein